MMSGLVVGSMIVPGVIVSGMAVIVRRTMLGTLFRCVVIVRLSVMGMVMHGAVLTFSRMDQRFHCCRRRSPDDYDANHTR